MATLEYTDAPQNEVVPPPIAGSAIHTPEGNIETAEGQASDAVAVLLSVVPGLGHIYKGHKFAGLILILATPMAVGLALLAATGTAGFGLALLPIYWFAVMFHVYGIKDRIAPGLQDTGEEY